MAALFSWMYRVWLIDATMILTLALFELQSQVRPQHEDWLIYLDEESLVDEHLLAGLYRFVRQTVEDQANTRKKRRPAGIIGQGPILYQGGNWFFRGADALRSASALYLPYQRDARAQAEPPDPEEQAAAYNAALSNALVDPYIKGIFFWAWSVPLFEPNWKPAAKILYTWYTSPQA